LCCHKEETAPVWAPTVIYIDFDECGQEHDPIVTDTYDIIGFEDYCNACEDEIRKREEEERDESDDDLPF
jgi:hypothetical protein